MSVFKCKSCGAPLDISAGQSVATCEYCGMTQTLPRLDDDRRVNLYDRANHFRRNNDYDKAMAIYEQILNEDRADAEAYWSIVLCRYGIEYVEDPATKKRMPTVNRAQFTSIFADEDYKSAVANADAERKQVYEAEARAIDEIQKGILAISQKEEPFDVFICYKETDANGRRTPDSVLANDLYHELTREGYKVFFSRITLEDKLGTAYEPYIFAALNSAKVMVALGTKKEYFSAVWVRNEWSRFLALIRAGQKKVLIPAYRDMDPYDLPEEFSHLQAQDMGKLGFMQDLIRGIKKLTQQEEAKSSARETVVVQSGSASNVTQLIKRGQMALEDGDWAKANDFFDQALNQDAENGDAYLGQFLAAQQCGTLDSFVNKRVGAAKNAKSVTLQAAEPDRERANEAARKYAIEKYYEAENIRQMFAYDLSYRSESEERTAQLTAEKRFFAADRLWARALSFAGRELKQKMDGATAAIYGQMEKNIAQAKDADAQNVARIKREYAAFLDRTEKKVAQLSLQTDEKRMEEIYEWAKREEERGSIQSVSHAAELFSTIGGYQDADECAEACEKRVRQLKKQEEEAIRRAEAAAKRRKTVKIVAALVAVAAVACVIVFLTVIKPAMAYSDAGKLLAAGKYDEAYALYSSIKGYKDVDNIIKTDDNIVAAARAAFIAQCEVGNTVTLGSYAGEEIEWIVLAANGDDRVLIAKYGIEAKAYNEEQTDVTWETCSLRKWLNGEFYETAFTEGEKKLIAQTTVKNDDNPTYGTEGANDTQDYVYLLSIDEVNRYFANDNARVCYPTSHAVENGAYTGTAGAGWWWLRSPGLDSFRSAYVDYYGDVNDYGSLVDYTNECVRPVVVARLSNF